MFENLKPFNLIVLGVCFMGAITGVLIFAFGGGKPDPSQDSGAQVVIWGVASQEKVDAVISEVNGPNTKYINASYVEKDPQTINYELIDAISLGKGPDVVLMPMEDIYSQKARLSVIPFKSFDQRTFQDSFIQEAELFENYEGYLALPVAVDPLVLYWNRDIFTSKGQTNPPAYWDSVVSLTPLFSDVAPDFSLSINKSAISLGDFRNVTNAKNIISALMLQAGTSITAVSHSDQTGEDTLESTLKESSTGTLYTSAVSAMNFYTQFANPLSPQYTWNRSLPTSLDSFVFGNLAMYIGHGSEAALIRSKNPNLNFDMALLPQQRDVSVPVTYGKMYGLSILSSSQNKGGALNAITRMTTGDFAKKFASATGLSPVTRNVLALPPADAYSPILYKSAIYSRGWLDPDPVKTSGIFQQMVESILAGRDTTTAIVQSGDQQMVLVVDEFNKKINEK